ncbi:MAG: PGF-CTERM sorting domain-containing protein [Euryarchaeota archaeon]|nr:PGF-CTERM sorting domain-containing protein [Euryarchaeota archaeon]
MHVLTAGAMIVYVNDTDNIHGTIVDILINAPDAPGPVGAMDISLTYNSSVLTTLGTVNGSLTVGVLVMNEATIMKPYPDNWTDAYISEADNQAVRNYGALANDITATDGVVNVSIISRYGFNGTTCRKAGDEGITSGFEAVFAITGLLAVAYLIRRR